MPYRLSNPNTAGLTWGHGPPSIFSPGLKDPLERGGGREGRAGRGPRSCSEPSLGSGLPLRATAACHMERIRPPLSHCQLGCSVRRQAVFAGVSVLHFITAGSAPLRPHVRSCGNSGGGRAEG